MDTLTSTGNGVLDPPTAGTKRRRRWPWVVLASFLILVIGFVVFAKIFLSTYQPLRANLGPKLMDDQAITFGETVSPESGSPFTPFKVPYTNGSRFVYGFTLVNRGPFGVTVESIGAPGGDTLRRISVRISPSENWTETSVTVPFKPFTLPADASRFVLVTNRFAGCSLGGRGSTMTLFGESAVFRIFGVTRKVTLPLPYSVKVYGHNGCGK